MNDRKLTNAELQERQKQTQASSIPLVVILNNIRSLYNVGAIFRTADGAGVEKLWLCGITGIPPDNQISKTALGAEKSVPWQYEQNPVKVIQAYRQKNYRIVLLEQTEKGMPYQDFLFSGPVCLVLGNEISGVGEDLLPYCDQAVEIEMAGLKNSLNVAVAFGITAYHLRGTYLKKRLQANPQ